MAWEAQNLGWSVRRREGCPPPSCPLAGHVRSARAGQACVGSEGVCVEAWREHGCLLTVGILNERRLQALLQLGKWVMEHGQATGRRPYLPTTPHLYYLLQYMLCFRGGGSGCSYLRFIMALSWFKNSSKENR